MIARQRRSVVMLQWIVLKKDSESMLLNVSNKNGSELLCYVGLHHVKNKCTKRHLKVLKEGTTDTVGLNKMLTGISNHMTTDSAKQECR